MLRCVTRALEGVDRGLASARQFFKFVLYYVVLSPEEKRRFLKALEEDQEFRYAVAGLLGLGEVLNELRRLREDFNNFVQRSEKSRREALEAERKTLETEREEVEREREAMGRGL
ncbi:paREP7 [Pyrobaculum aerophilum str. IM2]|uniref:PaREP7 n=2 Tax=Pyrobaculum aerophilum TaxID=13773 RepID=Q8ZWC1_PYRAE|nr:paREP7 [Pyrobaculum aerophilum str. IM2]HII45903.1 hypothetical protein [Pyrobaculum aerophilum]